MQNELFSWDDTPKSQPKKPNTTKSYSTQQVEMMKCLTKAATKFTEYPEVVALVDNLGIVDLEIAHKMKGTCTEDMLHWWIRETASKVITIMRHRLGYTYHIKISGSCGKGNNKGWLYTGISERKALGIDYKLPMHDRVTLHQLKYNGITIWNCDLLATTNKLIDIANAVAKEAIHYFLYTHQNADAHMFDLMMLGYDV